ncbi:MAG: hypothetical protein ABSD59_18530 [Terracidiphilus sp.]|jgi:hypothetical protein
MKNLFGFAPSIARSSRFFIVLSLFLASWATSARVAEAANPVPSISSLAPQGVALDAAAFTLTVSGTNFIPVSTVNWDGNALPTTYVSPTTLTASVPASDARSIGSFSLSVTNPPPGGGTSASSNFYVGSIVTVAVSGLSSGSANSLILNDNGSPLPAINSDGLTTYNQPSPNYNVTVATPPVGETCQVANGGPGVGDPNDIWVSCQQNGVPPPKSNWTPLAKKPQQGVDAMLLLSDGSVIANVFGSTTWYRLSPGGDGHYVNGIWADMKNSNCPHGDFASQVLPNGNVFVAGGEAPGTPSDLPGCSQSNQAATGVDSEFYDPVSNTWTLADPPTSLINPSNSTNFSSIYGLQAFLDMISETLPDGTVLMSPVDPMNCGDTLIFNYKTFTTTTAGSGWSFAGALANVGTASSAPYTCSQQEDTWVKLQDGSVITADPPPPTQPGSPLASQTSERYIPTLHKWVQDTPLGFRLYDTEFGWSGGGETGPAFLLPNGNALFIGGSPVTGTYTPAPAPPAGSPPAPGTWTQAPIAPNGPATGGMPLSGDDVPGAMMVNGKILLALNFAATNQDQTPRPYFFYEYDPSTSPATYTEVAGPGNWAPLGPWADCGGVNITMLDLPDGTVLMESGCDGSQLYVYQPSGPPLAMGRPSVTSIAPSGNVSGTFIVTGTGFNGISEGASYGDDAQMATNYPLVRLTSTSGNVSYARTYNWSSTGPMNGTAPGTTYFTLPANILQAPQQWFTLQVVVNGNASAGTQFLAGANKCGGTAVLTGLVGASCGTSCEKWSCVGPNSVKCEKGPTNACGACSVLPQPPGAGPQPGETCSCGNGKSGRFYCTISKQLSCDCAP